MVGGRGVCSFTGCHGTAAAAVFASLGCAVAGMRKCSRNAGLVEFPVVPCVFSTLRCVRAVAAGLEALRLGFARWLGVARSIGGCSLPFGTWRCLGCR